MPNKLHSGKNKPGEFAGMSDKIVHICNRMVRGDSGELEQRLREMVDRCLQCNRPVILDNALVDAALEPEGFDVLDDLIELESQSVMRIDPQSGRQQRVTLFALPVHFYGVIETQQQLPTKLADPQPIIDALMASGMQPDQVHIWPYLVDIDDLDGLDACERYRLVHQVAPDDWLDTQGLVDSDPAVEWSGEPEWVAGSCVVSDDLLLLGVCLHDATEAPVFENADVLPEAVSATVNQALGAQFGLGFELGAPGWVDDVVQILENLRPGRELLTELGIALSVQGIVSDATQATLQVEGGIVDEESVTRRQTGENEVTVEAPINFSAITVVVRQTDGSNAVVYERRFDIREWMDFEAVVQGILLGLQSLEVPLAPEHLSQGEGEPGGEA